MVFPNKVKLGEIMEIAFNKQGKARKQMITIIAEILHEKYVYTGTPLFEYRVGCFTINKTGTLVFDIADIEEQQLCLILDALKTEGFEYQRSDHANVIYKTDTDKISVNKMQFTVTNRRPKFTEKDKKRAEREAEKLLFEVFRKNE